MAKFINKYNEIALSAIVQQNVNFWFVQGFPCVQLQFPLYVQQKYKFFDWNGNIIEYL